MSESIGAVALSFVAGWVDTISFLKLGLFTSHITGNFVLIFVLLARPGPGLISRVLSVPVFVAVAYLAAICAEWHGRHRPRTGRVLLALEAVLLACFMLSGAWTRPDSSVMLVVAMLGVAAMAVQNAANRLGTVDRPATTVMTTNISQVVVDLARVTWAERNRAPYRSLDSKLPSVIAFAVGCACGAEADRAFGFFGLAVPVVIVGVVAALVRPENHDQDTPG